MGTVIIKFKSKNKNKLNKQKTESICNKFERKKETPQVKRKVLAHIKPRTHNLMMEVRHTLPTNYPSNGDLHSLSLIYKKISSKNLGCQLTPLAPMWLRPCLGCYIHPHLNRTTSLLSFTNRPTYMSS